jgi:F-type H+-transporting ATPase subunit gamma
MASLKDLRTRIASVKATQKITKAMQMVAAAKLRRAQMAAESARPYAERMDKVVSNLAGGNSSDAASGGESHVLLSGNGKDHVHLLVVCTSERGLCGAFNSTIVRLAKERINQLQAAGKTVKLFCVGKKGLDQLKRQYDKLIVEHMEFRAVKQISFNEADQVGRRVREMFDAGEFDVATLFYSRFKSVISQIPTASQIIPLQVPAVSTTSDVSYEYEPEQTDLLADILPRNISVQVFRALLENAASEQGSRMSAMDNATRNAGEMIKKQTQIYNRTRQAMITKELIEIISGAEAL